VKDEVYIRKAVELADGWTVQSGGAFHSPFCESMFDIVPDMLSQPHKDALAAQLVRQVDAIDGPNTYDLDCHNGDVVLHERGNTPCRTWTWPGKDRTMNALKCIVDSGVLE